MENNNLRNPGVPYAASGVPQRPAQQAPTPLFADVTRSAPSAPLQPTTPPLTTAPVTAVPTTPVPAPLPAATPPIPSVPVNPVSPKPPKKPRDWRKIILAGSFASLFLLFIGAAWLIFEAVSNNGRNDQTVNSEIASTSIPLSEFAGSGSLSLLGTQSLAVNGQLRANESFVLAPQAQPTKSERGQLYFDANTNQLAYYNGSQFVQIPGEEEDQATVLTLQGQSGNITLVGGEGVAVNGTTLTNTGVTSFGGATGAITLGQGVTIVDGTLSNTGVLGATGGTGISVTNDGNGNITISNTGAGTGTVTSPNGTPGRIAKFTGVQTIEDSLLSEAGSTVTVNGNLSVTGTTTLGTALGVNSGGTGATSLAANGVVIGNGSGALTAVTAGGVGECLMSTAGAPVFQACPGGGGGVTALNGLTGGLTIANASAAGSTITINDASTSQKGIAQFNSTNFSASGGVINTIQDIAVAATPTFGRLTLTSSQATSPMLLVNNTNASGTGNLIDLQLNGSSRMAISPAGNMTLTGTVNGQTISSAASFTGTLAVAGAASLNGGASVTGTLTANTITPTSAMTVGATSQSLTLQGNASTTLAATNGANTTTLSFQTPTANVNYRLLTATAGTYDICTTAGNCVGTGGGVTTSGGTTNRIPKFTGSQTLGDSIISDNGTTVTIGGVLAVNTITPTGALTIGATSQALTLQGTTTTLSSTSSGITNSLTFATPSGSNKTITVPNASGTVVVSASGPLAIDAAGNITCATCAVSGSGVTSLNGLTGALSLAYASGSGSTVTIQDASTSQKGVAQFNSTNFSVSSGTVNTIQDIAVSSAPTFGRLTVTSSQASNAMMLINNTNASASGNLLDVQLNGSSRLAVTPAGAMTLTGTLNGQTISSSASFTGTLAVAGAASLNGGATVTGTLTANTITPTSSLTVGATNQSFLVQGSAASTITATSGANTTTVAFQSPTAAVTYRFLTAAAGTYDVCTTVGNCASVGGGVTTSGGTTNKLAKFTGSQAIGDSIITDNGSTVTIGGTLAVNTLTPTAALTVGATGQNLTMQGATVNLTSTSGGITNTLTFATPSSSNKTITVPNASGTLVVSASGPLAIDSAGNITCATCAISGSGVTSLNSLTGALTIANASTAGSTITINDASTAQKGIAQFNSTNFSASGGVINTIQDIAVASAPTFGRLTVTSSQASNAMLLINNTNASASGNLLDVQLNGSSRLAVTPAGAMTVASTINGQTISSSASFTGTLAVTGAASLNGGATVTGTLTANTITPTGSLTVGATSQSFLVQGNASSTITATSGANTTTVAFQTPTANVTYRLLTAAAGTYDICTTVGNCAGVGGGVTTAGGTTNTLAKFSGSNSIADSIITDNGTTVTIGGTLAVNTITPSAAMTIGATSQNLTLQGADTTITATNSGFTNSLVFATPAGSNKTITLPNATGTVAVSASGPLSVDANGNITCATCVTSGGGGGGVGAVDSLNGLTGTLSIANASGSGSTITIDNASTSQKGIAQFNSSNFSVSSGTVNTIQDIGVAAAPTFGRLTVTSSQASNAMLLINNTNASASGNLLDVQLNGSSRLAVTPAGAMTLTGTLNGQTISSTANLTGTLAVAGAASLNGGATVTGTLTANTITPTGSLTVGATNQSFLVQGSSASTITATSGASKTTLSFQTPTANVTYRFLTAAAGTYDVCTTVGNCGGVTTSGGTTNKLAKFTGSSAIGDSILTDDGSTVTIGGTLAVNTLTPTAALTVGATSQNLTMQGAVVNLTSTSGGITNTLTFATPSSSNKTITIPNASGTLVVSASGPLAIDSAGNITCSTCATTSGVVTSLNSQTGALTLANASGSSGTITINDASTAQKGIAQFNSTNFSASSGTINTIQNINTTAAPQFGQLTLTSSQASAAMFVVNNTNVSASGNLLDLQLNGTSKLAVTPAGAMTIASTINGQTISSAASFTGTLAVSGAASLNGGATVTGTLTANTITPTSSLTVGATSQSFLMQGNASSTITATNGANTTTLSFQSPTASVNYRLLTAAAGTYDICTSVGNCGGVTTSGGTTGKIAKFTGANTLGDSIMTESGSTISVAGTVAATTAVQTPLVDTGSAVVLNIGTTNATGINLNQNTTVAAGKTFTVTSGATVLTGATVGDALTVSNNTGAGNIAVFKDNATAVLTIADGGSILAKNTVNSTTALQIQNSQGKDVISIDTDDAGFNFSSDNQISNYGIDDNTTGWAVKGTASSMARETINKRTGRGALRVNTNAANDGVKYNVTLSTGSYYMMTAYVKIGTGYSAVNAGTVTIGYSSNGTTDNTPCSNQDFPKVTPNGYVKLTCSIEGAPAPSGTPYFYVKQTDATARQLLIDDVLVVNETVEGVMTPSTGGINLQGIVTSPLTLQNFANSSNAFQILNDSGNSIFNVGNDDDNLIEDGSFERNELLWGGSDINDYGADPSISLFGSRSFRVGTNATANAGVGYALSNSNSLVLKNSTAYSLSWYARIPLGGTPFTDIKGRYYNGTTYTECTPTMQTVADYGWTRISCTFTTPASQGVGAAIYIAQTGATAHTFYLDGIRLEEGSTAKVYGNGTVSLDAVINTPVTIRNKYDTTNALTVQSFDGNTLFNVDTSNYFVEIGSTSQSNASTVSIATNTTSDQWVSIGSSFGNSGLQLSAGAGDIIMYTNSASATIEMKSGTNSTQAFSMLNASDVSLFTVDTSNSRVYIGNPTADTTGALLVLDTKTSAGDPAVSGTPTNLGAMYFNSNTQSFRCYANTSWRDCGGGRYVQSNQGTQAGNLPPAGDTVSNTTTATTFSDVYSVPANDCVPGRTYRVTAGGLYSTNGASQGYNIQLMWGSTQIGTTDSGSAVTPGITATNENWYMQATVTCYTNTVATTSAEVRGIVALSQSASGPPQMGFLRNSATGQGITTNSAQNLGVRMTWGTTGDSITLRNFIVEAVGP